MFFCVFSWLNSYENYITDEYKNEIKIKNLSNPSVIEENFQHWGQSIIFLLHNFITSQLQHFTTSQRDRARWIKAIFLQIINYSKILLKEFFIIPNF